MTDSGCTLVILGASGDLTRRKLLPSLLHLQQDGLLPDRTTILGVGRTAQGDEDFREEIRAALAPDPQAWARFGPRLGWIGGDLKDPATYRAIHHRLTAEEQADPGRGRLFYLSLPPSLYVTAIEGLAGSGALPRQENADGPRWARVIVEKPFGRDLASARALNQVIERALAEHQVYRIDHYLGKETVQNLLVFRFANAIFEPVWNREHIHHVQITAAETLGVEHRAGYYEEAGVVRDMFQNHLLQLLALTAMEPPASGAADAIRDEKVRVLQAIRTDAGVDGYAVRGQYGAGTIAGAPVPAYRAEEGVSPTSRTATFGAVRLLIDSPRWRGIPFYLRSGKRLARRDTEIAIQFSGPVHPLFASDPRCAPNVLVIQIQPDEGHSLAFQIKEPGEGMRTTEVRMDFSYAERFGPLTHDAYETLLLDAMTGDQTLFIRADAALEAWRIVDPIARAWDEATTDPPIYPAGGWGPVEANALIAGCGARWRS